MEKIALEFNFCPVHLEAECFQTVVDGLWTCPVCSGMSEEISSFYKIFEKESLSLRREKNLLEEKVKNQKAQINSLLKKVKHHEPSSQEKRSNALENKLWEARKNIKDTIKLIETEKLRMEQIAADRDFWKKKAEEEVDKSLILEEKIVKQRDTARLFSSFWKKLAKKYRSKDA